MLKIFVKEAEEEKEEKVTLLLLLLLLLMPSSLSCRCRFCYSFKKSGFRRSKKKRKETYRICEKKRKKKEKKIKKKKNLPRDVIRRDWWVDVDAAFDCHSSILINGNVRCQMSTRNRKQFQEDTDKISLRSPECFSPLTLFRLGLALDGQPNSGP